MHVTHNSCEINDSNEEIIFLLEILSFFCEEWKHYSSSVTCWYTSIIFIVIIHQYTMKIMIFILRENNYHYLVSKISDINEKSYLKFFQIISVSSFQSSYLINSYIYLPIILQIYPTLE